MFSINSSKSSGDKVSPADKRELDPKKVEKPSSIDESLPVDLSRTFISASTIAAAIKKRDEAAKRKKS